AAAFPRGVTPAPGPAACTSPAPGFVVALGSRFRSPCMRPIRTAALPLALVLALAACGGDRDTAAAVDASTTAIEALEPGTEPPGAADAIPASGDSRMDGYAALDF